MRQSPIHLFNARSHPSPQPEGRAGVRVRRERVRRRCTATFPIAPFLTREVLSLHYATNMRANAFLRTLLLFISAAFCALKSFAAEPPAAAPTRVVETNSAWRVAVYEF